MSDGIFDPKKHIRRVRVTTPVSEHKVSPEMRKLVAGFLVDASLAAANERSPHREQLVSDRETSEAALLDFISSLESQLAEATCERDTAREVGTVSYERAELAEGKLHTLRKALGLPDLEIKGFLNALAEARRDTERLDWLNAKGEEFRAFGRVRRIEWQIEGTTEQTVRAAIDSARGAPHE